MTPIELRQAAQHIVSELVELRQTRGITQTGIAHRIGISRCAVANFERNRYSPGIEVLLRYASAVGAELTFTTRRPQ